MNPASTWRPHWTKNLPRDLFRKMLNSSYSLDFLGLDKAVKERELENRLVSRLQVFLLELGYGFCFVGR